MEKTAVLYALMYGRVLEELLIEVDREGDQFLVEAKKLKSLHRAHNETIEQDSLKVSTCSLILLLS